MSKEFYLIENYKNNGKIGISPKVFEEITKLVIKEIDGVEFFDDTASIFRKSNIHCRIVRNQVWLSLNIRLRYGSNITEVSNKIRSNVAQTVFNLTEIMPAKINVNVADVR